MKHILIVEDDPFLRELAAVKLTEAGYTISAVTDGDHVLPFLAQESIDLVLLDLSLPHQDGISILRQIRDDARLSHLPVLVFTNDDSPEVRDVVIAKGGKYFLKATTNAEELLAAVASNLK